MGFIEETGAAQLLRDARIAPIYEGTNGIQAIDLVTHKLPLAGGAVVEAFLSELRGIVDAVNATNDPALGWSGLRLEEAVESLTRATRRMLARVQRNLMRRWPERHRIEAVRPHHRRLPVGTTGARGLTVQRRCGSARCARSFLRRERGCASGSSSAHGRRRGARRDRGRSRIAAIGSAFAKIADVHAADHSSSLS